MEEDAPPETRLPVARQQPVAVQQGHRDDIGDLEPDVGELAPKELIDRHDPVSRADHQRGRVALLAGDIDVLWRDRGDLLAHVPADVWGLVRLNAARRMDELRVGVAVSGLFRQVAQERAIDTVGEVPPLLRLLHQLVHGLHNHLGAATAIREMEPGDAVALRELADELRSRVAEGVECLVIVASDHHRAPVRERVDQPRVQEIEVLILVDNDDLVLRDRLRVCFEVFLNAVDDVRVTYGVVVAPDPQAHPQDLVLVLHDVEQVIDLARLEPAVA